MLKARSARPIQSTARPGSGSVLAGTGSGDFMIEITEVRVSLRNDEKLKAFVSITINDSFVVRGLKIIHGNTGLFVAMPSRKRPDGQHQDLAHPINDATRKYLTESVMASTTRTGTPRTAPAGHSLARPPSY